MAQHGTWHHSATARSSAVWHMAHGTKYPKTHTQNTNTQNTKLGAAAAVRQQQQHVARQQHGSAAGCRCRGLPQPAMQMHHVGCLTRLMLM
jgi:hypothetical protein